MAPAAACLGPLALGASRALPGQTRTHAPVLLREQIRLQAMAGALSTTFSQNAGDRRRPAAAKTSERRSGNAARSLPHYHRSLADIMIASPCHRFFGIEFL
jgi:hypothetical protein